MMTIQPLAGSDLFFFENKLPELRMID